MKKMVIILLSFMVDIDETMTRWTELPHERRWSYGGRAQNEHYGTESTLEMMSLLPKTYDADNDVGSDYDHFLI